MGKGRFNTEHVAPPGNLKQFNQSGNPFPPFVASSCRAAPTVSPDLARTACCLQPAPGPPHAPGPAPPAPRSPQRPGTTPAPPGPPGGEAPPTAAAPGPALLEGTRGPLPDGPAGRAAASDALSASRSTSLACLRPPAASSGCPSCRGRPPRLLRPVLSGQGVGAVARDGTRRDATRRDGTGGPPGPGERLLGWRGQRRPEAEAAGGGGLWRVRRDGHRGGLRRWESPCATGLR